MCQLVSVPCLAYVRVHEDSEVACYAVNAARTSVLTSHVLKYVVGLHEVARFGSVFVRHCWYVWEYAQSSWKT